jgi:CheY-like chemotaxis protein
MSMCPLKILYVEDEIILRRSISALFEIDSNIHMSSCSSNKEAIDLLNKEDFDVVIFDWWLQNFDTGEVVTCEKSLDIAKSLACDPIIIIFTSDSDKNVNKEVTKGVPVLRKTDVVSLRNQIQSLVKIGSTASDILETLRKEFVSESNE